jgi:hypothetical protein
VIEGQGTPTTVFDASKMARNNTSLETMTTGNGCNTPECKATKVLGSIDIGEMGTIIGNTNSHKADQIIGSSINMQLGTDSLLQAGDRTLANTATLMGQGQSLGFALGDKVDIITSQDFTGFNNQVITYEGNGCAPFCGRTTEAVDMGMTALQTAKVTATGKQAVAITNNTAGALAAMLERTKK